MQAAHLGHAVEAAHSGKSGCYDAAPENRRGVRQIKIFLGGVSSRRPKPNHRA